MKWKRRNEKRKKDCFATPQSCIIYNAIHSFLLISKIANEKCVFACEFYTPICVKFAKFVTLVNVKQDRKLLTPLTFPQFIQKTKKRGGNIIPDPSVNSTEFSRHNKNKRQEVRQRFFPARFGPEKKRKKRSQVKRRGGGGGGENKPLLVLLLLQWREISSTADH